MMVFKKCCHDSTSYMCSVKMWIFPKTEFVDVEHAGVENQVHCLGKQIANLI